MDHRIPHRGFRLSLVLVLASIATFLYLNNRFEGPVDPLDALSDQRTLTARFANTKKLAPKQPVLLNGLAVGRVTKVRWIPRERVAEVAFTVERDTALHDDAVVRIGERSLLGDPFLDVVTRGSRTRPVLDDGDAVERTRTSVNFDEALDFLDARGRSDVRAVLRTASRGVGGEENAEDLSATLDGVSRTVAEARQLTQALDGQEEQIAQLVGAAGTVLDEVGRREDAVRRIVGSGRVTLEALGADLEALDAALVETPRLLRTGRQTLEATEPLVAELRAPVGKLRAVAPDVRAALTGDAGASLRSVGVDTAALVDALPALSKAATPFLRDDLKPLLGDLAPLVKAIEPAARSLVPALRYLSAGEVGTSRAEAIAGLYASIGAATKGKLGTRGSYTRAGFSIDLAELLDRPVDRCPDIGFCNNAYPSSGDGLDPKPFATEYPQVRECTVPPRTKPKEPCK